jgi:hypothetical protein
MVKKALSAMRQLIFERQIFVGVELKRVELLATALLRRNILSVFWPTV